MFGLLIFAATDLPGLLLGRPPSYRRLVRCRFFFSATARGQWDKGGNRVLFGQLKPGPPPTPPTFGHFFSNYGEPVLARPNPRSRWRVYEMPHFDRGGFSLNGQILNHLSPIFRTRNRVSVAKVPETGRFFWILDVGFSRHGEESEFRRVDPKWDHRVRNEAAGLG